MSHNGWSNYETWAISLWMDNDEVDYLYWKQQATETDSIHELEDQIKEHHEEVLEELNLEGFAADLMNAAMGEVNWYEIAAHLWEDTKELRQKEDEEEEEAEDEEDSDEEE